MEATYQEVWSTEDRLIYGETKTIYLPFRRVSARALIVRRSDSAILGVLHRTGGRLALPGGAIDDGEGPIQALARELEEEKITLIGDSGEWQARFEVDYYHGYGELSLWHIFDVEDVEIGECDENIQVRWVAQDEQVWYPGIRERILLILRRHLPALLSGDFER